MCNVTVDCHIIYYLVMDDWEFEAPPVDNNKNCHNVFD